MEKEINIAAILKGKPKEIKMWTPAFGDVKLVYILKNHLNCIQVIDKERSFYKFTKEGKLSKYGEVCLFPSKAMQDWSKFAWKKGDVLVDKKDGYIVVFEKFNNDCYTSFDFQYGYSKDDPEHFHFGAMPTDKFEKADEQFVKEHLASIEKCYGGKLNLSLLEIEKSEPQFKDGDIMVVESNETFAKAILILKKSYDNDLTNYAFVNCSTHECYFNDEDIPVYGRKIRLATDSEKQQLFDALAKEGKRWNSETKTLEDLPKKCELQPFDRVLVRCTNDERWKADFFSYYDRTEEYDYICVGGDYKQCIPYNEETKHLLGTTDEWKGGEA